MRHFLHRPGPPLNNFVHYFWLLLGGEAFRKERILPSGTSELVINLHEDKVRIHDPIQPERYTPFSGAVLAGAHSGPFVCDASQHQSMLGVHFKPGGVFPFLGVLACELTDTHADLEDLWGRAAIGLRERLCAAASPGKRFALVEEALLDRLGRAPKRHPGIQIGLELFGSAGEGPSVRDVAREIGLCQRRFIQLFRAQVGLTPKLLCRILRFQHARATAKKPWQRGLSGARPPSRIPAVDWAGLAAACGYYDQSHLINDFQEFSGISPVEYLRRHWLYRRLKDNHVPLAE